MHEKTASTMMIERDDAYADFETLIRVRVAAATGPLFTTSAVPENLWNSYLENIAPERQQHYTCRACRQFIERFGGLVTISGDGQPHSAIFHDFHHFPTFFGESVETLRIVAEQSAVTGVFLSNLPVWGTPVSKAKAWTHISGTNPNVYKHALLTDEQAMAEKKEEFKMLSRALADFSPAVTAEALRILNSDALYRSEKALGIVKWFDNLAKTAAATHRSNRDNVIWKAVAEAPTGFCYIRSQIVATLMDDIKNKVPFEVMTKKWSEKLHPLQYQRPTAAPTEGAIDRAEKIFETMGLAPALNRRYATLADVLTTIWVPRAKPVPEKAGGTFGHLRAAPAAEVTPTQLPAATMTWEKFARTVLPTAETLQLRTPIVGNYYGLTTATDPTAPPIHQWDGLPGRARNPVSPYIYTRGSYASRWGLQGQTWVPVTAIFDNPCHWQESGMFSHHSHVAFFALDGAKDPEHNGLAMFPETLRNELREVRSVIEANAKTGIISGSEEGNANGLAFTKGASSVHLAATVGGATTLYVIDRWD